MRNGLLILFDCVYLFAQQLSLECLDELADVPLGRAVTYDGCLDIPILLALQRKSDGIRDPFHFISKGPSARKCQEHAIISRSFRIQDRRTYRRFVGCF